MPEEMTPNPADQPNTGAEGFGLPTLHKAGEVLPPATEAAAPQIENFGQAQAYKRHLDANSGPEAGAAEAMSARLRAEQADREAAARKALAEAEANPNIISDVPDFLKPKP
jgi:hypothetical protein